MSRSRGKRNDKAPTTGGVRTAVIGAGEAAGGARWGRWGWAIGALVGVLIYLPTLGYDFVIDDVRLIAENSRIRDLGEPSRYLGTSWWDWPGLNREYRPVVMGSFALNYAMGGLEPVGYHLVNVLLHGLNCALVWLLAWRLGGGWAASLAASLLFAVHPIHVETVSGVVGRAELMMAAGFLGALAAGEASREAMARGRRGAAWCWGAMVLGAAGVSVYSKEHGVLIVPALGLLMWAPTFAEVTAGKPERARLRERVVRLLPAGAGAALAVGAYLLTRRLVLGHWIFGDVVVPVAALDNPLVALEGIERKLGALAVLPRVAMLLLAPLRQMPDYSKDLIDPAADVAALMWAPGLAIAAGVIGGWFALRGRPLARFGVGLLGIGWVLSSNLVLTIGTILGERLLYLPSAGLCLTVGALALGERGVEAAGGLKRARAWAIVGCWGGALLVLHVLYLPHWSGNRTLAEYAVARGPESARLQLAQARELMDQGRDEEALEHAERALRIEPTFVAALVKRGTLRGRLGRERDGVRDLERAFPAASDLEEVTKELAELLTRLGEVERAEEYQQRALRRAPGSVRLQLRYGMWLAEQGRGGEAGPLLEGNLRRVHPDERLAVTVALARGYLEAGEMGKAREVLEGLSAAERESDEARAVLERLGGEGVEAGG